MYRLLVLFLVFSMGIMLLPAPALAQAAVDAEVAARVTVELSALEASGDINSLYDRIHPDARAEIPRAAVIGWFQNEFVPRGPGVSTVTNVSFVSWTWPVTGQTYPYTAEVAFTQPFADGTVAEDVVRLVQDHNGEWRWFFGRSRDFVNEQIAKYVPAVPVASQSGSVLDWVVDDIDFYWETSFAAAGESYNSPGVVWLQTVHASACGPIDPYQMPAVYCVRDQTIYLEPNFILAIEMQVGDFASITILAHEWGHHVQALDGSYIGPGNAKELQADCLAGSYALNVETLGYLEPGDLAEALRVSAAFGDPAWLPQDQEGTHGTSDDRIAAFMRGYLDGFIGCDFSFSGTHSSEPVSQQTTAGPELTILLPLQHDVPSDLIHTGDRNRSLADVAVNYTNPAETENLFGSWGWEENVTRNYEGTGWSSGITWVYMSIHRFDSASNAVNALEYSLNDQIASTGAWEVAIDPMAGATRALATSSDITIYVQHGNLLIRLTVAAPDGDPMPTAMAIMWAVLERINEDLMARDVEKASQGEEPVTHSVPVATWSTAPGSVSSKSWRARA